MDHKSGQKLNDWSYLKNQQNNASGKYGVIQSYDATNNTATVLVSASDSDLPGDIITNVLCPVVMGLQMVAPEPGRPCWVVFKGGLNDRKVMISHYFNHDFRGYDYRKQYSAKSSIPRYTLGL